MTEPGQASTVLRLFFQGNFVGLDRFFKSTPAFPYVADANAVKDKNTNWESDGKNVMYAGAPCQVVWAHTATVKLDGTAAVGADAMAARQVAGIGIPFVDGQNRPILSQRVGTAFRGWVDAVPDDTSFWIGNSFETHQESPELISGSDLTNATPLHVRLEYEGTTAGTDNFFEGKGTSDPFTSFVHIDAVLRLQQDGTLISSV